VKLNPAFPAGHRSGLEGGGPRQGKGRITHDMPFEKIDEALELLHRGERIRTVLHY